MTNIETVITTGGNGLVGSRVTEVLSNRYSFTNLDLRSETPVDITDEAAVARALAASSAEWVIHFAAFTDVTRAHEEQGNTAGLTYRINVGGTEAVVRACQSTGKKLLHISTAYVFDGEKGEPYTEEDQPNPIEWYGETKAQAEAVVLASQIPFVILRIDNPFRSTPFEKSDIVQRIASKLLEGSLPPQFTDSQFGPTYIDDTARIIDWVIQTKPQGIYHATNNEAWTPFAFAQQVAERLGKKADVQPGLLSDFLQTTPRPYQRNTALSCQKLLTKSGLTLIPVKEAIEMVALPTLTESPA